MKKLLALVALLCSLLLVAGCSSQTGGTAAVVDGHRITETQVDQIVSALEKIDDQPFQPAKLRHAAVSGLIEGRIADRVEAETGTRVDEADIAKELEGLQLSTQDKHVKDWLRDIARFSVLSTKVDKAKFGALLFGTSVDLNPRYGEWDPNKAIANASTRSISEPYTPR